jgi:23S rRNA (cytidine2498-2'-O)-methyltransferase
MGARFAHAVCNAGSEALLVREVAAASPGVVPAYRKRGLLTFRVDEGALGRLVFARVHGESLGLVKSAAEAVERAEGLGAARLHVYARDDGPDGPSESGAARARAIEAELADLRIPTGAAAPGERIFEVIVADDSALLCGTRVQGEGWRVPGGRPAFVLPAEAPSRAYLKLEEALAWSGLAVAEGERAVELGSAPGGAAAALLQRGVSVLGVDPADMDAALLARRGRGGATVTHLKLEMGALKRPHVPRGTSLLLCDVNLAPQVALRAVTSVASWMGKELRAAILTLKLNDQRVIDRVPELVGRVEALGLRARATQLPSNRREICVVATR